MQKDLVLTLRHHDGSDKQQKNDSKISQTTFNHLRNWPFLLKVPHFQKERKQLVTPNIRNITENQESTRIVVEYLGSIVESTTETKKMI